MTSSTIREISKTQQFKRLLQSKRLGFLMEAHKGFERPYRRGGRVPGNLGQRACELCCPRRTRQCRSELDARAGSRESMSDATDIPILLDGDTGYGNFFDMRSLLPGLEQRGSSGCSHSARGKLFPEDQFILSQSEHQAPRSTAD